MPFSLIRCYRLLAALGCIVLWLSDAKAVQAVTGHNVFFAPQKGALQPYLELFWEVDPRTVVFINGTKGWQGSLRTDIVIRNDTGILQEDHYILMTPPVADLNETTFQKIIDLKRYNMPAGTMTVELQLTDLETKGVSYQFRDTFSISLSQQPFFSDIQLVDTSFTSEEQNIFRRNNHIQIPLCTNFLDDNRKTLHYYSELYNTIGTEQPSLLRRVFISRKPGEGAVYGLSRTDTINASLVVLTDGSFSISMLPSGNYFINTWLESLRGEPLAGKSLFFQLVNLKPVSREAVPDTGLAVPANYLNLNKTFVAKYTAAQIRAILKMLMPAADPNERLNINEFLQKSDDMYARYFIYNFWLNRNKTDPRRAWEEYAEQVKTVNRLFGSSLLPGYETDRGIIYLKYGEPSERLTVQNEEGAIPYEVWLYNALPRQSGGVFLFYHDGIATNDFRLLHSTVNGEVRNRSWRSSLYITGKSPAPDNSKAEQYLGNK